MPSEIDENLMASGFGLSNDPLVVIAGHTHAARHIEREGLNYINTGTWTRLITLASVDDTDEAMQAVIDQLNSDTELPTFQRNTWAEVTPSEPKLHGA